MPLFGSKKDKKIDMPEVVDFSNDTWSFKGVPPVYQIQSDGFTYDIVDADSNDKNAISLGIAGMLIIVLNAKSPKIKENELLPHFGKVIKTRNWHTMTVKEANFLVQTAIKKLTNSSTSGDVFDLASYAPLEVKRVLLKTLFTISRMQLPPEFREEAEHRVIDDIVPDIFANPDYELALLTGLIVKADDKNVSQTSSRIETKPIIDQDIPPFSGKSAADLEIPVFSAAPAPEPDSAFAELQKIYGRRVDTPQVRAAAQQANAAQNISQTPPAAEAPSGFVEQQSFQPNNMQQANPAAPNEPVSMNQVQIPAFSAPQPNNPFTANEPAGMNQSSQSFAQNQQANTPFTSAPAEPRSIPQPSSPNFSVPQPNNPFAANQGINPYPQMQGIPQPPAPPNMPQMNMPYGNNFGNPANTGNPQMMNQPYPQMPPYQGNYPGYPSQMWQQNQPGQQNMTTQNSPQMPFPPQGWMQNQMQNNQQNMNMPQNPGMNYPPNYPAWQNPGQNPQMPPQNSQNS